MMPHTKAAIAAGISGKATNMFKSKAIPALAAAALFVSLPLAAQSEEDNMTPTATNSTSWVLEVNIKDGALEDLKALMSDMVAATDANEPGAANYEWFISEDGKSLHLYERYVNNDALMTHLAAFGEKFAERFLAIVEPTRFVVYGDPSSEARAALAGFGAIHMEQIGGFAR